MTLALHAAAGAAGAAVPILWKSNGFLTRGALAQLAHCVAAVNIDLKCADPGAHRRLTGAPLAPVLEALAQWRALGVWLEVSTPLIPGFNTDAAAIRSMARRVAELGTGTPWHLVRFLPDLHRTQTPPTTPELLAAAVDIGRECGLLHVYVERALGDAGRRTDCPGCGTTLIERGLWRLTRDHTIDGRCPACGRPLAGIWS